MGPFKKSCKPDLFNALRPRQNGRHFAEDIFKCIFRNENIWISIQISLKYVPKGPINNIPALVQIMACRRPGDRPLSELMMASLLTHICVTRPQWVNADEPWEEVWISSSNTIDIASHKLSVLSAVYQKYILSPGTFWSFFNLSNRLFQKKIMNSDNTFCWYMERPYVCRKLSLHSNTIGHFPGNIKMINYFP